MSVLAPIVFALALPLADQSAPLAVVPPPAPPPVVWVPPAPPPPPLLPAPKPGKLRPVAVATSPGGWITTDDYPVEALRDGTQGTTAFRLLIGEDGSIRDCVIVSSSGVPALDEATCLRVRQRARFYPATDQKGKPTLGSYSNKVRWVIPPDGPGPQPGMLVQSFDVMPDGSMANCRVDSATGSGAMAFQPGPVPCLTGRRFEKPVDTAGQPVTRHVVKSLEIRVSDPD